MSSMYQLLEIIGNSAGASNKARADVNAIAENMGLKTICVQSPDGGDSHLLKIIGKIFFEQNLIRALKSVGDNGILLVQLPLLNLANRTHKNIYHYCKKNRIRVISFIHDVNELRGTNSNNNQPFYDLLKYSTAVISHNSEMTKHLIGKGVDSRKIVNLGVFDYILEKQSRTCHFKKQITIAGNLDVEKVQYLKKLDLIKGCKIVLYGPNYTTINKSDEIEYKGVVEASELPYKLTEGFGLVWDGTCIETCAGTFGEYLKYNNPHKLSLYLASGLPVIIWAQAAEAKFVKDNGVGLVVNSLMELPDLLSNISKEDYERMVNNVETIQSRVTVGFYASSAIKKALALIK